MNILQKRMIERLSPWADQIMRQEYAYKNLSVPLKDRMVVPTADFMKALWITRNR